MERLDRIVSSFIRKNFNKTLKMDLKEFFKNFCYDIADLADVRVTKLSSSEIYIKEKLISNTIEKTENFIEEFNEYIKYHSSVWEEIIIKYRSFLKEENEFESSISEFERDLKDHLKELRMKTRGLLENLIFIENNYELSDTQKSKLRNYKLKLNTLLKLKYEILLENLFKGKLLNILHPRPLEHQEVF